MNLNSTYHLLFIIFVSVIISIVGVLARDTFFITDIAMLFLLMNVLSGSISKPKHAYITFVVNVIVFHYFILPDFNSFKFQSANYIITYTVLILSGIIAVQLTQTQRKQLIEKNQLRSKLKIHYQLAKNLSAIVTPEGIAVESTSFLNKKYNINCAIFLMSNHQDLKFLAKSNDFPAESVQHCINHTHVNNLKYLWLKSGDKKIGCLVTHTGHEKNIDCGFLSLLTLSLERATTMNSLAQTEASHQVEKIRTTLLASVSHDLKTPLGTIIGSATTLCDKNINIEQYVRNELLLSIASEGERLNQSLNKLIDITRYTSGTFQLKKEWIEPEEVIGSALQRVKTLLYHHNIELSGAPMLVELDSLLIEQVISNLIENSAKYSPKQTTIRICYDYNDGHFSLSVFNQGEQIPEHELKNIFERFYRLNNSIDGTGLGLAICNVIVSAHGGSISAKNTDNQGVCFKVHIPCRLFSFDEELTDE
ncbi:sensor histidine kinase [Photobacterium leiognathi]|uniref:sensor histidine kinase n=1 Tax=Photobacterium leiognathi TaxID=553611 RepID=UPI00298214B3|nr:ATP-binding protein [Photobacterium leiognathi]